MVKLPAFAKRGNVSTNAKTAAILSTLHKALGLNVSVNKVDALEFHHLTIPNNAKVCLSKIMASKYGLIVFATYSQ